MWHTAGPCSKEMSKLNVKIIIVMLPEPMGRYLNTPYLIRYYTITVHLFHHTLGPGGSYQKNTAVEDLLTLSDTLWTNQKE